MPLPSDALESPFPSLLEILEKPRERKQVQVPFAQDISAGKNTYVYDAHTYHTKVPPQGIASLIQYYTHPGEVVLDPFCGSGMTGVAALETQRQAILSDLSPAATFIAQNLCSPIEEQPFLQAVGQLLQRAQWLQEKLYQTSCRTCGQATPLLYTVWSYGLICSHCQQELILWDVARDERKTPKESKIKSEFICPHCQSFQAKRLLKRTRRYPVQVGYRCCGKKNQEQTATPSPADLARLQALEEENWPADLWFPTQRFPEGLNTRQPIRAGIESIDQAYTRRGLWAMAYLWQQAQQHPEPALREKLLLTLTSLYQRVTVFSEFRFWGGSGNQAHYNVPHIMNEQNVFLAFHRKALTLSWYFREAPRVPRRFHVSTRSACHLDHLPEGSIDFIFTDPPFGSNINYSEMNFLWESWLGRYTDPTEEVIIHKLQKKTVEDYRRLLTQALAELYRVLRQDGWMCLIFHNSSEKVWKALQRALSDSGFEVHGSQIFDKKHGTFKMFVAENTVGYDLVLHCQKRLSPGGARAPLPEASREGLARFLKTQLQTHERYQIHYLHVNRAPEFDYRRLYAEWLCHSLAQEEIALDFETFKSLVAAQQTQEANVSAPA